MKRLLFTLVFLACHASAATTRYLVRPVYSNIGFSIVKWGVLKEEGRSASSMARSIRSGAVRSVAHRCRRAGREPRHEK